MKKHMTFERIVEISTGVPATEVEKIHIENCPLCKNRIESAEYLDKGIMESVKAAPIIDYAMIESIADDIFDKYSAEKTGNFKVRMFFAGATAIAASLLVFAYVFINFQIKKSDNTIVNKSEIPQHTVQNDTEVTEENDLTDGILKIAEGSVISRENYELKAVTDAMIVHEYENYFSVMEGTVEFKVKSGTEFMVNINNSTLVRVLGTVFKVKVDRNFNSVEVSQGLVEVIDLARGKSSTVAKGENMTISRVAKIIKQTDRQVAESVVKQSEIIDKITENIASVKKSGRPLFNVDTDMDLIKAEISDLENALKYSTSPVVQLRRLFELYRKTGQWGSIINFWRTEASEIDSRGNPFLKEMHFAACEASIKMFLYDNGICRKYRAAYPDGPDPKGMKDYLKMAW